RPGTSPLKPPSDSDHGTADFARMRSGRTAMATMAPTKRKRTIKSPCCSIGSPLFLPIRSQNEEILFLGDSFGNAPVRRLHHPFHVFSGDSRPRRGRQDQMAQKLDVALTAGNRRRSEAQHPKTRR